MATTYNNAQIGIVDESGNVNVIYPITTGNNVAVTPNTNYSQGTTVQKVVTGLGAAAFQNVETDYQNNTAGAVASASALYNAVSQLNSNMTLVTSGKIPVNPSDTSNLNIWIET